MNYAELVEKAREIYESGDTPHVVKAWLLANIIYPTDKSEDERIKREILELVSIAGNGNQFEEIKDWLEKQCKQSTDKIKTKFKLGDYVVSCNITPLVIWRIIGIDKDGYYNVHSIINPEYDEIYRVPAFILEKDYHLWTIQDAKDGDVLVSGRTIVIVKHKHNNTSSFDSACAYIGEDDSFISCTQYCYRTYGSWHPATKEQRDLLFQKMRESGYEWDDEKKELKKIESKKLDPNKVIEWLEDANRDFWMNPSNPYSIVEQFKKDFGL